MDWKGADYNGTKKEHFFTECNPNPCLTCLSGNSMMESSFEAPKVRSKIITRIRRGPSSPHDSTPLWRAATSPEGLGAAWERVRANDGAAGGDRMTCRDFALDSASRLRRLSAALREGVYHPGPIRRVDIPKASGGVRTLSIPCVADRVAQGAVAQALDPLLEAEFEDVSYAYRRGRSVKQALQRVQALRAEGYVWALDADIEAYFDRVPHDRLMRRVERSLSAGPLTELIALWLETGGEGGRGLAQGSPLSPLLANLYLDDLDEAMLDAGLRIVRYAGDFVVFARTRKQAEEAQAAVAGHLQAAGLELHPVKTRVRSYDEALRYLGAVFVRSIAMRGDDAGTEGVDAALARIGRLDREAEEAEGARIRSRAKLTEAGHDPTGRTLFVMTKGRRLSLKNLSFAVYDATDAEGAEELLAAVHPTRLDRIEVGPDVAVDAATLRNALAFGVRVAFVNGHGEALGLLAPEIGGDRARRHLAQARHTLDPHLRLELARLFVEGRIANQRAFLRRINYRRGMEEVNRIVLALSRHLRMIGNVRDLDALRGEEGQATRRYWRGFSALLMHGWSLPARIRKPAPDPVNVALNVAVSLLHRDVGVELERAGLHPGFGTLHSTGDRRDAAVYDLMEVFRAPLAESVVMELFNNRQLREEHFHHEGEGWRIGRDGYCAVVRGYEERASNLVLAAKDQARASWRSVIRRQALDIATHVEGQQLYRPYLMGA